MIFEPIVCSVQSMDLSCVKDYHYLQTGWIELALDPRQLGVPSGVSKMISEPMRCLVQIMHLSCTDTYTVSRRTEMRFHMIHITLEFHRVLQKWFLSLWYFRCKPCTYLVLRLAQSPNELNRACTWASSLRNTTGPKRFLSQRYVWRKPCTYIASRLPVSRNRLNRACSWASSPRSTTGCIQNDFWASGMYGTNCAPILCQDYHYLQMDWIELPHEPCHLGVPPGVSKTILWAYGIFGANHAPILRQDYHYHQTDSTELAH
jgi:hypothetical protein